MKAIDFLFEEAEILFDEDQPEGSTYGYDNTAFVRASSYPLLQEKIANLNKKAEKLGSPPILLDVVSQEYKDEKDPDTGKPTGRKELYYKVKIEGSAPKIEGYRFLAVIQHEDGGNIIKTVPGKDNNANIKNFYDARPEYCDHCKKRRQRNDTFIITDKEGNLRQVGRNCLTDFLGGADPRAVLFYFSIRDKIQDAIDEASEGSYTRREDFGTNRDELLGVASRLVRKYGYRKRPTEYDVGKPPGTAQDVWWVFFSSKRGMTPEMEKFLDDARDVSTEDKKFADDALAWLESLPQEDFDNSTFLNNVKVALSSNVVSSKNVGFAVALLPAYMRAIEMQRKNSDNAAKSNEWVGQVNSKITNVKVKVVDTRDIEGQYGVVQLVSFEDENGNSLKWFNSSSNRLDKDKEYLIKSATVKGHEDYKGRKQTMLKLVKV
jgi:hypothetical protein